MDKGKETKQKKEWYNKLRKYFYDNELKSLSKDELLRVYNRLKILIGNF